MHRTSDSPRQEFERGRAIEVDRTADRWSVVQNRNKIRISRNTRPVICSNRFGCLSDGDEPEVTSCDFWFPKGKAGALLIGYSLVLEYFTMFQDRLERAKCNI